MRPGKEVQNKTKLKREKVEYKKFENRRNQTSNG